MATWRALVLGGGGSTGEFQMGALPVVARQFGRFDFYAGIGCGSLHASILAQYPDSLSAGVAVLQQIWTGIRKTSDIFETTLGGSTIGALLALGDVRPSVYGSKYLRQLVQQHFDWKRVEGRINWGIEVTSMTDGLTYYVTNDPALSDALNTPPRSFKPSYDPSHGLYLGNLAPDFVTAGGSVPMILPPVKIVDQMFAEGGVRRFLPFGLAVEAFRLARRADPTLTPEFVVIDNYTRDTHRAPDSVIHGGQNLLMRTIAIMTNQIAQGDVLTATLALESMGVRAAVHQLYPRVDYWLNPQDFDDATKRQEMLDEGATVATGVLGSGDPVRPFAGG
jgi:predicted acylesterase/phospholipase RssA